MAATGNAPDLPFFLRGNYAPVADEVTATDLAVEGSIPPQLNGLYLRNGPNPRSGASPHWFLGDGMVHGVRLGGGGAAWYRNRWVRTRCLEEGASTVGTDGSVDLSVALANTNVIGHAGRILALVETSFPTELSSELETLGTRDFDRRLTTAMTAHPKICPRSGELHFFGYSLFPPFLTYHRADAGGTLVQSEVIDVKASTMMHDFAITESRVLFMDLPIVFDLEAGMSGSAFPFRWNDDYGARLGVMPRGGRADQVRWLEIEPCYIFHPLNAYDDGETVVLDVARYPHLWRDGSEFEPANLHRYSLDLEAEKVSEQPLDERPIEFPRVDERRVGSAARYGYAAANESDVSEAPRQLVRYDLESGCSEIHDFAPGTAPGEAVFVPAHPDAAENEGWLLTFVYDAGRDGSDLVILDADDFGGRPVATIRLPQRVPFGFHGNWLPDPPGAV